MVKLYTYLIILMHATDNTYNLIILDHLMQFLLAELIVQVAITGTDPGLIIITNISERKIL